MVIAFQSVVVLSVLLGLAGLLRLTRTYELTTGGRLRSDRLRSDRLRSDRLRSDRLSLVPILGQERRQATAVGDAPDDRLRMGLAVPSNGQACGPN